MAKIKRANRGTSVADLANITGGFAASGESQFTRRVSRGNAPQRLNHPPRKTAGKHTLAGLITECERRLEHLEVELRLEDNPNRRAKLARDLEIRGKFLTKLLLERDGGVA